MISINLPQNNAGQKYVKSKFVLGRYEKAVTKW